MQPYLKSTQILKCPSDSSNASATYSSGLVAGGYPVSYIVNASFHGFGRAGTSVSLAQVESSATTVYLADGSSQSNGVTTTPSSTDKKGGLCLMATAEDGSVSTGNVDWGGPNPRHLETAVFGFADGHVKSGKVTSYYGVYGTAKGNCLDVNIGCQ